MTVRPSVHLVQPAQLGTSFLAERLALDPEGRLLGVGQHIICFNFMNNTQKINFLYSASNSTK